MPYLTVTGSGRLGRDAELRFTKIGVPVASLNIATSEYRKGQESAAVWIEGTLFGLLAEKLIDKLVKGAVIDFSGELLERSWDSPEGQKTKTYVKIKSLNVREFDKPEAAAQPDPWASTPAVIEATDVPF